ncbi:NUDIX domain-containing protein [Cesiribacter andamanensis]|uniref:GDP-mannose pyrophosphatase n=1 Tax=Cesiribacter andamanensis AMV16 TaxID=1279009 RepID=M7N407_9BACT|nr:NUDIX hydrolase [Cesiribacter andamanensis]EMR03403.1 ADP-ribose pyrophosphatase [Cesiribacter andamanensis AMV16]
MPKSYEFPLTFVAMNEEKGFDPTHNPWKTVSSQPVYENPWIRVREDKIINPSGNPGIYGVVSFKNLALGIIPLDADNNTWLVGQYRYSLNEWSWEIPMGGGPMGRDVLESAQRELKEETGYTAARWTNIMRIHTSNSVTDEVGYVFLAEELTPGDVEPEETEQLVVKKLPLAEAIAWVMEERITDSISIAGLLKVARLKGL